MTPEEKAVIQAALYLRLCVDAGTAGDPPRIGRLLDNVDALIHSCPDCNRGGHVCPGDDNLIGHGEADCGEHDEDEAPAVWIPATFAECLPGDRIRIGTTEADVLKVHRGQWHARNREWTDDEGKTRDHQTRWDHEELRMDLSANPGLHAYPPDGAIEILADFARRLVLNGQKCFPGTSVDG